MAMNYLEKKRQEEQQTQPAGLQGVSENTRTQQAKYENGYVPSQQTQTAQQNLAAVQQQKPQSYNSKYGAALDNILAQIQNPQDFKYSFDGDEMFKYYADLYTQNAKQGAQNAMGQAVGLTGGYGNSWASSQANQAYQQALLPLFERGLDLRDRAYQQYQDKQNNMMDTAGLLQSMDATDYGRYRDTVGDYYADLDRAQAAADNERAFDYNNYMNMLDYWQGAAQLENADYRTGQQMDLENERLAWQQDVDARDFAENVRRADQDETYRQQAFNEQVRQADLDEAYRQQTFNESVRQADLDEQYRRDSLQQNAEQFAATTELDWAKLQQNQQQFEANLSEEQRQYNQRVAIAYVTDILANGQMPSNDLLVAAGLSYEDAMKLMAQLVTGGSGGTPDKKKQSTTVKEAAENTGNYLDELAKNTIFNAGNGAEAWIKNYMGYGNTADALASIASGHEIDPDTGRAYTDRKKADAAEAAEIMYGMQDQYDANRNAVDTYVNKMKNYEDTGSVRPMTAEENAEWLKELREKGLIK